MSHPENSQSKTKKFFLSALEDLLIP